MLPLGWSKKAAPETLPVKYRREVSAQLGSSLAARAPVTDAGAGITDPGTFACCDSGFEEADVQVLRLGEDQETDGTMKLLDKLLRMVCCSERS